MTDKQKNELRAKILLRVKAAVIGFQFKTKLENDLGLLDFNNPKSVKDFIANIDKINSGLKVEIQQILAYNSGEENQTQIFYFSNTNEEVMTTNVQVGARKLGFTDEELTLMKILDKYEMSGLEDRGAELRANMYTDLMLWHKGEKVEFNEFTGEFAAQDEYIAKYNNQFGG